MKRIRSMARSTRRITLLLILTLVAYPSTVFCDAHQEGKQFGRLGGKSAWAEARAVNSDDLLPTSDKGQSFDPRKAKQDVEDDVLASSEACEFIQSEAVEQNELNNRGFDLYEEFFQRADLAIEKADSETELTESHSFTEPKKERCYERDAPYDISFTRTLDVEVERKPAQFATVRICDGHKTARKFHSQWNCEVAQNLLEQGYVQDPTVSWHRTWTSGGGAGHRHKLESRYSHVDGCTSCDHYHHVERVVQDESWEEEDHWVVDSATHFDKSQSPDCTLRFRKCLDSTPHKEINGVQVQRQCWKEQLTYLCKPSPEKKPCPFRHDPLCELIKRHCVEQSPYGCAVWEHLFHCYRSTNISSSTFNPVFGRNDESSHEYKPNSSFAEVVTKLSVFEEVNKEVHAATVAELGTIEIFQGKPYTCSKNIAEGLLYDCCFSYSGLAADLKLTQCTPEELNLRDLRDEGMCHYLGSYSEKFLDLWKSRDVHVFCCFRSKLSRVVHEQAREQIELQWGTPKKPNCRGLFHHEITSLNLSDMDLSEVYSCIDVPSNDEMRHKIDSFEQRIRNRLQENKLDNPTTDPKGTADPRASQRIRSFRQQSNNRG